MDLDLFTGYDDRGQPMYRDTGDGFQCTQCEWMNGEHEPKCPNSDEN